MSETYTVRNDLLDVTTLVNTALEQTVLKNTKDLNSFVKGLNLKCKADKAKARLIAFDAMKQSNSVKLEACKALMESGAVNLTLKEDPEKGKAIFTFTKPRNIVKIEYVRVPKAKLELIKAKAIEAGYTES